MKILRGFALAAAALCGAATVSAQAHDDLTRDLARRAATYRDVFDRLSSPDVSEAVLEALATREPDVFEALGDGLDVPDGLRCSWVKGAVLAWLRTPYGREEKCFLRQDLSVEEYILYRQIVRQFYKPVVHEPGSLELEVEVAGAGPAEIEVPPGPFLEALRAAGLVKCRFYITFDTSIQVPLREVLKNYCFE
jgi:hypothetical protein